MTPLSIPDEDRCTYRVGSKLTYMRRQREDGTTYAVPVVVGGRRCKARAVVNGRCMKHRGIT